MTQLSMSVVIVEDHEGWIRFHSSTLQNIPKLQVIGEARDGLKAVQLVQQLQPDLILLDIGLPKLNGLQVAQQIREVSPASKVLFVSENRARDIVEKALSTGASGYVVKSEAARELVIAVKAVLEGSQFVSTKLDGDYNPYLLFGRSPLVRELLASLIEVTAADFGNVQLFDSAKNGLRIVAHHGFESEFLNHFDTVNQKNDSPCSGAMIGRSRIVVTDVGTDSRFSTESRSTLLRANVRSVQSTPLIDSSAKVLGVMSTHYSRPEGFMPHMWKPVDDLAADFLAKINAEGTRSEPLQHPSC